MFKKSACSLIVVYVKNYWIINSDCISGLKKLVIYGSFIEEE